MRWRRTDAVQEVDALLLTGADAAERLHATLGRRPALYGALTFVAGADWAALFAAPMVEEREAVLPRVAGTTALYRAAPGWWFPVGTALAVPDHAREDLLAALAAREGIGSARVIAIPSFAGETSAEVDLYHARDAVPVRDLAWPEPAA